MKPKRPPAAAPAVPVVVPDPPPPLATLAKLRELCEAPVTLELQVRGTPLRFTGRRLKPGEVVRCRSLLEAALPPLLPPEQPGGEQRYDLRNPGFVAQSEEQRRLARAYVLFRAWPIFAEEAPLELNRDDLKACADWLDEQPFEAAVLEVLFSASYTEVVGVNVERVSFT